MLDRATFDRLLSKYAKVDEVRDADPLFAEGLDFSSIGFTEFVMAIEDETGLTSTRTSWTTRSARSGSFTTISAGCDRRERRTGAATGQSGSA